MPTKDQKSNGNSLSTGTLLKRVAVASAIASGCIGLLGGSVGFLVAGPQGLTSALLGSLIALMFSLLTLGSVAFGAKQSLAVFYGLVLGGWLLKVVIFGAVLFLLRESPLVHGPTFFFALVAAVLGCLAIDSWVALRARIPVLGA